MPRPSRAAPPTPTPTPAVPPGAPRDPAAPRVLLLLPTATYRTAAFVAAARRLGVELSVASERPSAFAEANPAGLLTLDLADPDRAVAAAAQFAAAHPLAGVVGVDDDTAVVAAAIAAALGLRGNPVAATRAARDKYEQRRLLAARGVPVPHFALHGLTEAPADLARRAPYPCVLKPLRLAASRGVIRADTVAQFVAAFERLRRILAEPDVARCGPPARQVLVEEFIPGDEYALEGLLVDGELRVLALFDKPDPLDGPYFEETIYVTPSRLSAEGQARVRTCAADAARALGLQTGPVHAELRYNERGPWMIEIAARPIGGRCSAALRFAAADGTSAEPASLEELIIEHAIGRPLPPLVRERSASGVMMIPVPRAGVLQAVRGVEAARAVPLIADVTITAHVGQTLVPWPEGARYPGFIFARGDRPDAVVRALREAHRRLEFVLA